MTNFFRQPSNSSPLYQAIEKATDPNKPEEDWTLIVNICDFVSTKEEKFFSRKKKKLEKCLRNFFLVQKKR